MSLRGTKQSPPMLRGECFAKSTCSDSLGMSLRIASFFKVLSIDLGTKIWYLITTERSVGKVK
jgi:hypothetical protein